MARYSKSVLPLIILSQVSEADRAQQPLWGYRISELVERESAGRFRLRAGTLYPLLASLESDGLLKSEWGGRDDGPRRKYFHLTPKGGKVLVRERESYKALLSLVLPSRVRRRTGTEP
jgi:PadR family transcriptional regulator, regulatory protein PadR